MSHLLIFQIEERFVIEMSGGEKPKEILPGAVYECMRCATGVSGKELLALPEPTCANCGYRIFRKVRGQTAKQLKAE
jgi:DNA-directed RNA polymerase subunit RPC12/RpoP